MTFTILGQTNTYWQLRLDLVMNNHTLPSRTKIVTRKPIAHFICFFIAFFFFSSYILFFFLIGWQQRVFTYRKIPVTYKKKKVLDMELFWQNIQHEEHRNNGKSTMCGTTMIKVGDGGDGGGGVMSTVLHVSKGTIYFTGCALNYAVIYDRGQTRGSGLLGGGGKELT